MCRSTVPSSLQAHTALIAGLALLLMSALLARHYLVLRAQVTLTERLLLRARATVQETERVKHARDEVIGGGEHADVFRRSYDVIAGVPFAILEASPMPKDTVSLLRDAQGAVANGVYSTLWGINRTIGRGILDELVGGPPARRGNEERPDRRDGTPSGDEGDSAPDG
jgi:hypothetical protein